MLPRVVFQQSCAAVAGSPSRFHFGMVGQAKNLLQRPTHLDAARFEVKV
jgi:hypothetical protein